MSAQVQVIPTPRADDAPDDGAQVPALLRHTELLPPETAYRQMLQMGEVLVQSGLMPQGVTRPAAAFAIMQKGRELGLAPMAAIEGITIIQGKPTCSAHLMLALVKRAYGPGAIRVAESTNQHCTVEWRTPGWPVQSYSFTWADAERAGLTGKQTWKQFPAAMLRARCISAVVKMAFPEVVGGMMVAGELPGSVEMVTEDGDVVPVGQPAPPAPDSSPPPSSPPPAPAAQMATTGQRRAINDLRQQLGWSPAEVTAALRERYAITGSTQMTAGQADDFVGHLEALYREAFPEPPAQAGIDGIPDAEIRDLPQRDWTE